jgi:hypothetical protein
MMGKSLESKIAELPPERQERIAARYLELCQQVTALQEAAQRLEQVGKIRMPWLEPGVDMTPSDGGPEASGAPIYKPNLDE